MSATIASPKRRSQQRSTPWDSSAFQEPVAGDVETITVQQDDPFQSIAQPPGSIGQRLDAELARLADLTADLQEQTAQPFSAEQRPVKTTNARDAWCAVVIMGLFIVAGIAWTTNRLSNANHEMAALTQQIEEKETAIVNYQQEIKRLRQELLAARIAAKQTQSD